MIIEAGKEILVLRYNNYKNYGFIQEHIDVIAAETKTWMLKLGKPLASNALKSVIEDGGYIIFKAPKKDGNIFFLGQMDMFYIGEKKEEFIYPMYYEDLFKEGYESNGTWMRIKQITEINASEVNKLVLKKNGKRVNDILGCTRTAVIYSKADEALVI